MIALSRANSPVEAVRQSLSSCLTSAVVSDRPAAVFSIGTPSADRELDIVLDMVADVIRDSLSILRAASVSLWSYWLESKKHSRPFFVMTTLDRNDHEHAYTAYYCEENVYHLVEWLTAKGHFEQVFAVFVSNDMRQNLLYYQRAAAPGAQYVVWDYHVFAVTVDKCESGTAKGSEIGRDIALRGKTANACVWDLDTQLGLKVPLEGKLNILRWASADVPHRIR